MLQICSQRAYDCRHAMSCFLTRGDLWFSWEEGLKVVFYVVGDERLRKNNVISDSKEYKIQEMMYPL